MGKYKFDWTLLLGVVLLSVVGIALIHSILGFAFFSMNPVDWNFASRFVYAVVSVIWVIIVLLSAYGEE